MRQADRRSSTVLTDGLDPTSEFAPDRRCRRLDGGFGDAWIRARERGTGALFFFAGTFDSGTQGVFRDESMRILERFIRSMKAE